MLTEKRVMRAEKSVLRAGTVYNNINHSTNILSSGPFFKQYRDYGYEPMFNGVYSRDNLPGTKDGSEVINLYDKQNKAIH